MFFSLVYRHNCQPIIETSEEYLKKHNSNQLNLNRFSDKTFWFQAFSKAANVLCSFLHVIQFGFYQLCNSISIS